MEIDVKFPTVYRTLSLTAKPYATSEDIESLRRPDNAFSIAYFGSGIESRRFTVTFPSSWSARSADLFSLSVPDSGVFDLFDHLDTRITGPFAQPQAGGIERMYPAGQVPEFSQISLADFGTRRCWEERFAGRREYFVENPFDRADERRIRETSRRVTDALKTGRDYREFSPDQDLKAFFSNGEPTHAATLDSCVVEAQCIDQPAHMRVRILGPGDGPLELWHRLELKDLYTAFKLGRDADLAVHQLYSRGLSSEPIGEGTISELIGKDNTLLNVCRSSINMPTYDC